MTVKLLTEHHLEFLTLKGSCTGSSQFALVKMPHCWKSHVVAQLIFLLSVSQIGILVLRSNDTDLTLVIILLAFFGTSFVTCLSG